MVAPIVSFALGVLLIQCVPELPGPLWIGSGLIAMGLCVWRRYRKCLLFLAGLIWAVVYADIRLSDRLAVDLEGQIIRVTGRVVGLPVQNEQRIRFDLAVSPDLEGVPSRLRLNWYYPEQQVKAGQQWALTVKLKRPHGSLNPGGFDYERWLFREGIGATGYVRKHPVPLLLAQNSGWFDISTRRQAISDELDRLLNKTPNIGVIKALTIGDRHQLSPRQWDRFRQTGTVHLMAISGLHIGLVAGLAYFLISRFWLWTGCLSYSPQKIASLSALLVALFYSAMAGFSVPTQRALIMLAVVMLAVLWQRNARPDNTLAVALFAVLLLDPLAILSAGFWLSFLAVAVIAYTVTGRLATESRWLTAVKIHWLTALALSPLLLFFFQQVSLIAPVANCVAVPMVSLLVVPIALLAVSLLWAAPSLAMHLLALDDSLLEGLNGLLAEFAALPFAYLPHCRPSLAAMILAGLGLLLILAPRGIPARWLGWFMLAPVFFAGTIRPKPGEVTLTLLDVGQGLSAVVQTADHALVFDTGARFDTGTDMGVAVILPFLQFQGIGGVDVLVISHGDNDHIGGAAALLSSMPVGTIYSSVSGQLPAHPVSLCESGQSWLWDGVRFSMLAPGHAMLGPENDNSCVLKIDSGSGSLLLTGDIEKSTESWLVQSYGGELKADVLVVPHHGSKTSSTASFLRAVQPRLALIPAGYKNRFGFPHEEVLQRYAAERIKWLNSADQGAISVYLTKEGLGIVSQRHERGSYWNMKPSRSLH